MGPEMQAQVPAPAPAPAPEHGVSSFMDLGWSRMI